MLIMGNDLRAKYLRRMKLLMGEVFNNQSDTNNPLFIHYNLSDETKEIIFDKLLSAYNIPYDDYEKYLLEMLVPFNSLLIHFINFYENHLSDNISFSIYRDLLKDEYLVIKYAVLPIYMYLFVEKILKLKYPEEFLEDVIINNRREVILEIYQYLQKLSNDENFTNLIIENLDIAFYQPVRFITNLLNSETEEFKDLDKYINIDVIFNFEMKSELKNILQTEFTRYLIQQKNSGKLFLPEYELPKAIDNIYTDITQVFNEQYNNMETEKEIEQEINRAVEEIRNQNKVITFDELIKNLEVNNDFFRRAVFNII